MLLHKTPRNRRTTYTYRFTGDAGEQTVTLRPGENGVTAQDIELLHRADDSEVYYNLKALNPEMSLSPIERRKRRAEKDAWAEKYIERFQAEYGYIPNDSDIADAVNEAFPKNWPGSVDELQERCGNTVGYDAGYDAGNDTGALSETADFNCDTVSAGDVPAPVERMREIVSALSPNHQGVYRYVILEQQTKKRASELLGISDTRVSQITKELMKLFAEDKELKKFFR